MTNQFPNFRRLTAGLLAAPLMAIGLMLPLSVAAAQAEETHIVVTPAAYGATRSVEIRRMEAEAKGSIRWIVA